MSAQQQPFSDEIMTALEARARQEEVPLMGLVERAINAYLFPASPRVVGLKEAADTFLGVIDQAQAALIRDICQDTGHTPADYLLSYIYLAHERGETAALVGEHVMLRQERLGESMAVMPPGMQACDYCRKPFQATRRGQRFCPEPADPAIESCGRKHSLAELHKHRQGRTRDNRYAPPQQNVEVYRRAAQQAQDAGLQIE